MSKAKIASKSKKGVGIFFKGQEVVPVKFISETKSFMAAEYKGSAELVFSENNQILRWSEVKSMSELRPV